MAPVVDARQAETVEFDTGLDVAAGVAGVGHVPGGSALGGSGLIARLATGALGSGAAASGVATAGGGVNDPEASNITLQQNVTVDAGQSDRRLEQIARRIAEEKESFDA